MGKFDTSLRKRINDINADENRQEKLKQRYNISRDADIRIEKSRFGWLKGLVLFLLKAVLVVLAFLGALILLSMITGNDMMIRTFTAAIQNILSRLPFRISF